MDTCSKGLSGLKDKSGVPDIKERCEGKQTSEYKLVHSVIFKKQYVNDSYYYFVVYRRDDNFMIFCC